MLGVAAYSYAETYSTLTRRGYHSPFRFTAEEAWAALESVRAATQLIGLTPAQMFDIVRNYASSGGIGPRLYDRITGETAVVHRIPTIMTWNVGPMRVCFLRSMSRRRSNFRKTLTDVGSGVAGRPNHASGLFLASSQPTRCRSNAYQPVIISVV